MQQPANMSGVQVIVMAQAAPIDNQSRYLNVTSEFARMFTRLGVAHVVIGALCISFQIISFAFSDLSAGHGIWTGSLFVVTGVFGILAGRKGGKCQVIAFHVLSTISAAFALLLLCIAAPSAAYPPHGSFHNQGNAAMVMEALLAVLALAEGIVALCSSVTGCTIGACCCNCGGSCCCPADPQYQQFQNPIEPDLSQQQFFTSNQQPPMFNPNQQPPMLNTNQQQPRFNPNQQQPMLNANQQQPRFNTNQQPPMFNTIQQQPKLSTNRQQLVFNPSQQQLMFSPNNQQLMFNPNQQLLIFNPNQQQPMFNPNQQQPMFNNNQQQPMSFPIQPMTGFYPQQQQDAHLYAHQPNATLNSQQPDFSAFSSGATGQRPDAGPNYEPIATPLPEETTGNGGGNGSDEGPGFADDVEMLSLEGPFVESENRF